MCDFKRNFHVFAKFVRLIGVLWIRQFIGLQLEVGGYRVRSAKTRHKKFLYIFCFVVLHKGLHANPAPRNCGTDKQKNSPRDHCPRAVFWLDCDGSYKYDPPHRDFSIVTPLFHAVVFRSRYARMVWYFRNPFSAISRHSFR